MKDYKTYFKDKNITIMGLGLLGRQINIAKFLSECGANLLVTDIKPEEELGYALEQLEGYKNIEFVLGEHRLEDFRDKDMIIEAASIPLDSPFIEEARKHDIPVEKDASLFLKLAPDDISVVGITGTRGKSTVTTMIARGLENSGKKVFLGGNIRGIATLPFLEKVTPDSCVVLELDSWQLQGFGEAQISPHVAVFTTFMSDHLNYYKGNIQRYFEDKSYIFRFQEEGDKLILGKQVRKSLDEYYDGDIKSEVIEIDESYLPSDVRLPIPGEHNRYNAALALRTLEEMGVKRAAAIKSLSEFESLPGRLEKVASYNGVDIYNDTNSTTPDALSAALNSFPGKNIVLIAGGADKRLSYADVVKEIEDKTKQLILLPGAATEKMKKYLTNGCTETDDIEEAVRQSIEAASDGDIILFSPGATSFNLFKNEYDRGDKFLSAVDRLTS